MSQLMDLRELAAYLRLDRQTLYNWLHQRKLSGIKMGGVWRFQRQTIDRWLQEQTILAAPSRARPAAARQRRTSPASAARVSTASRPRARNAVAAKARQTPTLPLTQPDMERRA